VPTKKMTKMIASDFDNILQMGLTKKNFRGYIFADFCQKWKIGKLKMPFFDQNQ
tara:strand:- start:435 stop:596 length:162 start_codon:yes stop_codon:yes gene_type:complete